VVKRKALLSAVREMLKAWASRRPAPSLVGREADHHVSDSLLDKEFAPQQHR